MNHSKSFLRNPNDIWISLLIIYTYSPDSLEGIVTLVRVWWERNTDKCRFWAEQKETPIQLAMEYPAIASQRWQYFSSKNYRVGWTSFRLPQISLLNMRNWRTTFEKSLLGATYTLRSMWTITPFYISIQIVVAYNSSI